MIQLQYADESGNNCGGLYINVHSIAAIRAEKGGPERDPSHCGYWCKVLLNNGVEYRIVNRLNDVLDEVVRAQRATIE